MTTMRERIARAIASNWIGELVWDAQTDEQHDAAFRMADAVLAEMAEPTGKMWLAGRKAFDVEAEKFRAASRYEQASAIADRAPEAIFCAMLAAAGEPE